MPGTLDEIEQAVVIAESSSSIPEAADQVRPPATWNNKSGTEVSLEATSRWLRRRINMVKVTAIAVIGIYIVRFLGMEPTMTGLREKLKCDYALMTLRQIAEAHLYSLPPPVGFGPRVIPRKTRQKPTQHNLCPDHPP